MIVKLCHRHRRYRDFTRDRPHAVIGIEASDLRLPNNHFADLADTVVWLSVL